MSNYFFEDSCQIRIKFHNSKLIYINEHFEVYLKGKIYNYDLSSILSDFKLIGNDFFKVLDGSFIIIIKYLKDKKIKYKIITDRTNSLKFYYAYSIDGLQISDTIDIFNKNDFIINSQAVACYLANGNMLNGITIFEGVHMSKQASIYTFDGEQCQIDKYWQISFKYKANYTPEDKIRLKKELKTLITEAIMMRTESIDDRVLISLSAGYDARSILGIIKRSRPNLKIDTFTYRPTDQIILNSDAEISELISIKHADKHFGLKSYNGDFMTTLKINASEGKCIANFCDEIDAIKKMSDHQIYTDVYAGDEWFGRLDVPLNSDIELLDSVSIAGSWGISWLKNILKSHTYNKFINELDSLTAAIISETKNFKNPHDKKDFLYLHQRVNNVNLSWREYFTSQMGFVHNPYLSKDILNFYEKTPPDFRIEKKFFIETITEFVSEIFLIPIANERKSLASINYKKELTANRLELFQYINNSQSYLESVISKEEVIFALNQIILNKDTIITSVTNLFKRSINVLRRQFKILDKMLYPLVGPRTVKTPTNEKIVIRLLLMWIYLEVDKTEKLEK